MPLLRGISGLCPAAVPVNLGERNEGDEESVRRESYIGLRDLWTMTVMARLILPPGEEGEMGAPVPERQGEEAKRIDVNKIGRKADGTARERSASPRDGRRGSMRPMV